MGRGAGPGVGCRRAVDYRELVLVGAENVQLSEMLLHPTCPTHRNRRRLLKERTPTVEARADEGIGGDAQQASQQRSTQATPALK
jgi:hypothetical protein